MSKIVILTLLVVGGFALLAQSTFAVTPKPRPLPTLPPTTPVGNPVISAS